MTDWATQEAAAIFVRLACSDRSRAELVTWLADKLRLIYLRGEKEGIARLGHALNAKTERPPFIERGETL